MMLHKAMIFHVCVRFLYSCLCGHEATRTMWRHACDINTEKHWFYVTYVPAEVWAKWSIQWGVWIQKTAKPILQTKYYMFTLKEYCTHTSNALMYCEIFLLNIKGWQPKRIIMIVDNQNVIIHTIIGFIWLVVNCLFKAWEFSGNFLISGNFVPILLIFRIHSHACIVKSCWLSTISNSCRL